MLKGISETFSRQRYQTLGYIKLFCVRVQGYSPRGASTFHEHLSLSFPLLLFDSCFFCYLLRDCLQCLRHPTPSVEVFGWTTTLNASRTLFYVTEVRNGRPARKVFPRETLIPSTDITQLTTIVSSQQQTAISNWTFQLRRINFGKNAIIIKLRTGEPWMYGITKYYT